MARLKRSLVIAALGSAAVALLLFVPLPLPPAHPLGQALGGAAHVLLFAGLAWLWGRCLPSWARGGVLWCTLVCFSALLERLQPCFGRSAEWMDWFYGMGGAACVCWTTRLPSRKWIRLISITSLCLLPLSWAGWMLSSETRAFPVLAEPDALWSHKGWSRNRVRLTSEFPELFCVKQDVPPEGEEAALYPGLFRHPACADWSPGQSFQARLFWPGEQPAVMAVRWDDRPGNPPYGDRFQVEFAVTEGWNSIVIPLDETCRTPEGRHLQLDSIEQWGVFLVSDTPFDYFLLDAVRLELQ